MSEIWCEAEDILCQPAVSTGGPVEGAWVKSGGLHSGNGLPPLRTASTKIATGQGQQVTDELTVRATSDG
jgi:hypothetical protein